MVALPGECVPPRLWCGGGHTCWVERGWGMNILEDARHSYVLFICKYFVDFIYFWRSNKKQRSCDGRGGGAQRPVWGGNELKKTGARSARARTRGQNPLVIYNIPKDTILQYLPYLIQDEIMSDISMAMATKDVKNATATGKVLFTFLIFR